jgi:ABC-type multidrug transport system ATPase subunit
VKPGQMLLVLARPGGGSTTLLRILSNHRDGTLQSRVTYGSEPWTAKQRKSSEVRSP